MQFRSLEYFGTKNGTALVTTYLLDEQAIHILLLRENEKNVSSVCKCVTAVATIAWADFDKILNTGFLAQNLGRTC